MLQLKHLHYIKLLTDTPAHEIKPVKFGYQITWSSVATYYLASQMVPVNMSLLVLRTQCYLTNADDTASDFQFYRCVPSGAAWWVIGRDTGTNVQNWTNPNAPSQLALDSDELLLFPSGTYANLLFLPSAIAPAGTWRLKTTIYGYFVPPQVSDALGGPQAWINVQQ